MRTALVLGGTGQVGRAAVPALVAAGWHVRVLSRTGAPDGRTGLPGGRGAAHGAGSGSGAHVAHPDPHPDRVEHLVGDRADAGTLDRALGEGVDLLVDVVAYDDRDAAPLLARADRIGSAVVVSSAAVYVDGEGRGFETEAFARFDGPVPEDGPTVAPGRDGYAAGKAALEAAWLDGPVPVTVLRPGAIHGDGCRQPREWVWVRRVLDGRRLRVLASGGRSRFATTSTRGLAALVVAAGERPGTRVVNAADADAPTVAEIAATVEASTRRLLARGSGDGPDAGAADAGPTRTVLLDGPPRGDVGATPWSVPDDVVLDLAASRALAGEPPTYAGTVDDVVRWLLHVARHGDVGRDLPGVARLARGGDLFPYAAEDALVRAGWAE
ncbi:NAD(P)-dependent oxidoreductase [Cellulomonas endophytica]|uniref:NAD(P)-dependent oxidoreductase n=1 Tax=Cellulomonas endophytica TaxID=2494735 RepID=UPI0010119C76|nr:NAD(P)-dependent oxidoreductase [Cellulomonas endophytica]